ncbi:MAG: monovalent cation/H(+) antiporter subunit G [Gammaproteobacteria bacterium]|nr:monovalent cation/H(+) antiporter subunit G [Gammaproteobacteria bacterium]MDJ0872483.1 monovalent cation/H(+) antiporter subunit G [Gammaproteobacteria bacterium]
MSTLVDFASGALLLVGSIFILIGGVGLLRMPDFYTRIHAAGITDTLGATAILLGLALQAGWDLMSVKLVIILLFVLLTSPTASHSLAKAALDVDLLPLKRTKPE